MAKPRADVPYLYIETTHELKQDLINIAKNKGLTLTSYLRTLIIAARDGAPDHLKRPYKD